MRVLLAFAGCVLIWGSTWYAIALQLGVVPKEWSLVYRFAIASGLLFAICIVRRERLRHAIRSHLWMAATGLFLFSGTYVLTYTGAQYLTSGLVAITFSLLSFLNIVNSRIFLGNTIRPDALFSAFVGISGLIFIFRPEIEAFTFEDDAIKGLFFCLLATAVCSLGNTVAGAPGSQKLPLLPFNAFSLGYGMLFNLAFAVASGKAPTIDYSISYIGSLLYLAVVGTVIAFTMYIWLIDQIGVGRAAYMSVMTPVIALTISTILEGFVWTVAALVGLGFVILGNILMIRRRNERSSGTEKPKEHMVRGR